MGLGDRLMRAGAALVAKDASTAGSPTQGSFPVLGSVRSSASVLVSQGTAMAVSAVYACVARRAVDVARCRPRLLHRKRKSGTPEEIKEHDVAELFKKPNRMQDWFEFAEQTMVGYLLRGNAYAPMKRDKRFEVSELVPVNPDAVMVLEGIDGGVYYNVNRIGLWQIAMLREFPTAIPAEDVFHLRGLTFNALVAASTIGLARDSIGVAMALEQQAARWLANGARPSVVLTSKKALTKVAADRLKKAWKELFGGLQNTGETVVLEDGVDVKEMQLKSVDLEFIRQREFNVLDICRFYGTPPFKIGVTELRGVDIEAINQEYVNSTIMPDLHRLEQRFEFTFDLPRQGLEVSFDERVLLRADSKTRYGNARIGLLSGFLAPNEVRTAEGLEPVEGGDQVFRPLNMAALGSDVSGNAPDGAGRPASGAAPPTEVPNQKPTKALASPVRPEDGNQFLAATLAGADRAPAAPADEDDE